MALSLVTAATAEPLNLHAAKLHLRVEDETDDVLIETLAAAAREYVETHTRRKLITQTWDLKLDAFPACGGPIVLPYAPVSTVTSVSYIDTAGVSQVWPPGATGYSTSIPAGPHAGPALVYPAYGLSYPSARGQRDAVTVRFVCGYGASGVAVPASILAAQKLLIGHWYLHREAVASGINTVTSVVPFGVDQLLWPFRSY